MPADSGPETSRRVAAPPNRSKTLLAWAAVTLILAIGIYLKNPAVALMGGLCIRLGLGLNPVPRSGLLGKYSLQAAIVLLGLTLGADRLISVSAEYGWIVAAYVLMTLLLGWVLAQCLSGDRNEQTLLASGTAICGGTAIATLAPLLHAKPHQLAVSTTLVFLLNAVALITFPAIGHGLGLSQEAFGAWVALAIHDTSSVVATAALYGDEAAEVATTVKLGRTLWLIPLVFVTSLIHSQGQTKLPIPGFVLLFVAATVFSSLFPIGPDMGAAITWLSKALLVLALAMIGLEIDRQTVRQLSVRSVMYALILWLLVVPGALLLIFI